MADTVTATTVTNNPRTLVRHFTNNSDGTGESNVVKVDKSAFTGPNGSEPTHLIVEQIQYDVAGMSVKLSWDHTSDETIAIISGQGCLDWSKSGGLVDTETGGTGDILATTIGHTAGDTYDITLRLRKKD